MQPVRASVSVATATSRAMATGKPFVLTFDFAMTSTLYSVWKRETG